MLRDVIMKAGLCVLDPAPMQCNGLLSLGCIFNFTQFIGTFWKLGRAPIAHVQTHVSEAALVAEIVRDQSGLEIYVSLKTKSFHSQGWSQERVRVKSTSKLHYIKEKSDFLKN